MLIRDIRPEEEEEAEAAIPDRIGLTHTQIPAYRTPMPILISLLIKDVALMTTDPSFMESVI